jgi:hypothetical protein
MSTQDSCSSGGSGMIYSDFNYETVRTQNLKKVQDYYNQVLTKYTIQYNDYLNKSASNNQSDKDQAQYLATEGSLPKINLHLIDIINQLNTSIDLDVANLQAQQEKVNKDTLLTLDNRRLIEDLNRLLNERTNEMNKNSDSYDESNKANTVNKYWEWFFIIVNLIMFSLVLYMIYKVLFS